MGTRRLATRIRSPGFKGNLGLIRGTGIVDSATMAETAAGFSAAGASGSDFGTGMAWATGFESIGLGTGSDFAGSAPAGGSLCIGAASVTLLVSVEGAGT